MKTRCYNKKYPQYKDYGGRGIKVCDRWLGTNGFKNFFSDMGERPLKCSLDRINNELGYSKNNCRWATRKMQSNNTRKTCWLEYNGEKMSLSDWAQKKGFPPELIYNRIMNYKWSTKKALETPWVKKERNKK